MVEFYAEFAKEGLERAKGLVESAQEEFGPRKKHLWPSPILTREVRDELEEIQRAPQRTVQAAKEYAGEAKRDVETIVHGEPGAARAAARSVWKGVDVATAVEGARGLARNLRAPKSTPPPAKPGRVVPRDTPVRPGKVTGDPGVLRQKVTASRGAGELAKSAEIELRVAKQLQAEGEHVHFLRDAPGGPRTPEFEVRSGLEPGGAARRTEVKFIRGGTRALASKLAEGVEQVGPSGQVIIVRPTGHRLSLQQFQEHVGGFTPKEAGVTFRVIDEATLPQLRDVR